MTVLPNPFVNPSASDAAGAAAAKELSPLPTMAAVPFPAEGPVEAPAVTVAPTAAGATDCISELFHHERRLVARDIAALRRDQQLRALYDTLDPPEPPLFLRRPDITDYRPDPSLRHILKVFFAMEA